MRLILLLSALLLLPPACASSSQQGPIFVVGSINADVIVPLERMPTVGETVVAKQTESTGITVAGGKGANTAVTCARMGSQTRFACLFGSDSNAAMLERTLRENNVDLSLCSTVAETPSGMGLVLLCDEGGSTCIVCSGSNGAWDQGHIERLCSALLAAQPRPSCLMLQMEVPQAVNEALARTASQAGIPVFQDLGWEDRPVSPEHLRACTYLSPNLSELRRLTRLPCASREEIVAACRSLQARGARNILVTLGGEGSLLVKEAEKEEVAGSAESEVMVQEALRPDQLVDETGAGDNYRAAFCSAHFAEGRGLRDSMLVGAAAAAVSVSRMGAIPACCRRAECDALLSKHKLTLSGGSTAEDVVTAAGKMEETGKEEREPDDDEAPFPLKFASRLNSMSARLDLWESGTEVGTAPLGPPIAGLAPGLRSMIKRQGRIRGLDLVDFNYPQHLTQPVTPEASREVLQCLSEAGLAAGAVCLRFPKDMRAGALTSPDEAIRRRALQLCCEACEWSERLGCREVVIWSAFDGYDYSLQVDHDELWALYVAALQRLCDKYPKVKISLEYKPTDENTRFFTVPSTGAAMLLAGEVKRRNFGLTLDFGHCLMAGENPAQSVALTQRSVRGVVGGPGRGWGGGGKLFGIQLGDGYGRLGAEDGLAFASVHPLASLELVYWLAKTGYSGHVYFDTFPRNEDPQREAEYNIRQFRKLWRRAQRMLGADKAAVEARLRRHDAMGMLEYLEGQGL